MQKSDCIIGVEHVSKFFGDKAVLNDVNLSVRKGEFVTILGPSGCGKTTLLRLIAGFQTASEGIITIAGKEITQTPPHKRPVNTVFQKYALFPHLNVFNNIAFGLKLKKLPAVVIEKKVKQALKMVGMTDYEYRDVDSLSGGQQQRVAIARAIVNEPEVLLLDEPLAALDLKMRKDMQMELKEMHKSLGITFIYVTPAHPLQNRAQGSPLTYPFLPPAMYRRAACSVTRCLFPPAAYKAGFRGLLFRSVPLPQQAVPRSHTEGIRIHLPSGTRSVHGIAHPLRLQSHLLPAQHDVPRLKYSDSHTL